MPHISKNKLRDSILSRLDKEFNSVIKQASPKIRAAIMSEILTPTEKIMFAKRLLLILMLRKKVPDFTITRLLQMSPSTVARFSLKAESGKFPKTGAWLESNQGQNRLFKIIENLLLLPFEARKKSLSRLISDIENL
ncbi:MAG: hypothetical protein AAB597_00210 [Patescibacteria group bacterium]